MYQGIIYCATSPSGKKYYGFTYNLINRKIAHKKHSTKKTNRFYCAIKKYGFNNFVWTIIETYESDDKDFIRDILRKREIFWIEKEKTYLREFGYNMTHGGDGGDTFSNKSDNEKKLFIQRKSELSKGKNNPMYGKNVYDIWVENFGKETADIKLSERKEKSSLSHKGKSYPCTEEKKEKLRKFVGEKNSRYVKLSVEITNKIIDLYLIENYSITKIQKVYNLNYYKVKKILMDNNVNFTNIYKTKIK